MELLSKVLNDVNQIGTANSVLFVYHSHPVHKARVVVVMPFERLWRDL